MQPNIELELLERLVLQIDGMSFIAEIQNHVGFMGVGINAALQWFLFRYHFIKLIEYEFFIEHYDTASHFARNRYNTFKSLAMVALPVGIAIMVYSLFTRFNSAKFIDLFGTSKSFHLFNKPSKFKVRIKP